MLKVWLWLMIVSAVGIFAASFMGDFRDDYKAYGEVPIPGSARLHLPAGDVVVSFHCTCGGDGIDIPENLELVITAPSAAAQPSVTDADTGSSTQIGNDGREQVKVAHIPVAGDYTITTNGKTSYANPRLAFGHDNYFGWLRWLFVGLLVASALALVVGVIRKVRSEPAGSAAELLASGQRVRGVLKSFRATGKTARSMGMTPTRPEFLDYPFYALEVELRLPNQAAVVGRSRQQVPPTEAANLAIDRELNCAVDPADPANRFIVDWG